MDFRSTTSQDSGFGQAFLERIMEYISYNFVPEDIFEGDRLEQWAKTNGFGMSCTTCFVPEPNHIADVSKMVCHEPTPMSCRRDINVGSAIDGMDGGGKEINTKVLISEPDGSKKVVELSRSNYDALVKNIDGMDATVRDFRIVQKLGVGRYVVGGDLSVTTIRHVTHTDLIIEEREA